LSCGTRTTLDEVPILSVPSQGCDAREPVAHHNARSVAATRLKDIDEPRGRNTMLTRRLLLIAVTLGLGACAGLMGREPVQVNLVGIEALDGEGLELRMALKLRMQNPNDEPVDFDGVSLQLDVQGSNFATGVSDQRGSVPRFGETVLVVPVSVSGTSVLRQVFNFATGDRSKVRYELRGRLAGTGLSGVRFGSSGDIELPAGLRTDTTATPR
jgi:LEA14-like dessication related protein